MKKENGVTLITLIITLIILTILTFSLSININQIGNQDKKSKFESDLNSLQEEVNQYYARVKELPIINKYTNVDMLEETRNVNDGNEYYVLDIKQLQVKLNYGNDYVEIENNRDVSEEISDLTDVYIINKQSHTIYYPKGVEYNGKVHYTIESNNTKISDKIVIKGESTLQVAKETKLKGILLPENNESTDIIWNSSDNSIATINEEGIVTPLKEGKTIITAVLKEDSTVKRDYEIEVVSMLIYTVEDLLQFAKFVNDGNSCEGSTVKLMNDIDLSSVCSSTLGSWVPIGDTNIDSDNCFKGTFEGNKHTVSGIYINTENEKQGLFGVVKNGKISNLTVSGNIKANAYAGGLVGKIEDATSQIIQNCINNCTVEIPIYYAGGIVGMIENCTNVTIKNCNNNSRIESTTYDGGQSGGIVGSVQKTSQCNITNCFNTGNIISNRSWAGGILGSTYNNSVVSIENVYNTGSIEATEVRRCRWNSRRKCYRFKINS